MDSGGRADGREGQAGKALDQPAGEFLRQPRATPGRPPARLGLRSFIAALALYDAFVAVVGNGTGFALKWPNDVLLNGGKLTGILLEASGPILVIGMGVNLLHAPPASAVEPGAVAPVSLLGETGVRVTPARFLDALAPAMTHWEAIFRTEGFAQIRTAWLSRAARIGEKIIARTGSETREGIFETIDQDGNLVLRMGSGTVAIPAADVFF